MEVRREGRREDYLGGILPWLGHPTDMYCVQLTKFVLRHAME